MESVYWFYPSKTFAVKAIQTSTLCTQNSIVTTQSGKKWHLWYFQNDTNPIKVHLQKTASPSTNLFKWIHVYFTFAAFLRVSQKMNSQYFTVKLILAQKHSSGHLTSLVMQEIHLNLTAPHTLWCSLVLLTDLISPYLQDTVGCDLLILICLLKTKVSKLDGGFLPRL